MRRPTDKKTKRQQRMEQTALETGYTIPSGAQNSGYSSGYDQTATGGYHRPQRRDRYESERKDGGKDDGIPL